MRIKIIRIPDVTPSEGVRLDHFEVGRSYTVGTLLGAWLLAEGVAAPAEEPPSPILLRDADPRTLPPNLIIEKWPPYTSQRTAAPDRPRRRKKRKD